MTGWAPVSETTQVIWIAPGSKNSKTCYTRCGLFVGMIREEQSWVWQKVFCAKHNAVLHFIYFSGNPERLHRSHSSQIEAN